MAAAGRHRLLQLPRGADKQFDTDRVRPRLHPKTSGARELGLEHRASRVDRSRPWTNTIGQSRIRRDKNAPRFIRSCADNERGRPRQLPVAVPNLTSIRNINLNRRILLLPTSEPIACTLPDIALLGRDASHGDREKLRRVVDRKLETCRRGILAPLDSDHSEAINYRPSRARTRVAPT